MAEVSELSGRRAADLGNAISDAIHAALLRGMETDEAACIAVSVAADYARAEYGDAYLPDLAKVVVMRAGRPMPEDAST